MDYSQVLELYVAVREFRLAYGVTLSWDRQSAIADGSKVNIAEPVLRDYDHATKVAVPFDSLQERRGFILFDELDPRNREEVRRLFPNCDALAVVH